MLKRRVTCRRMLHLVPRISTHMKVSGLGEAGPHQETLTNGCLICSQYTHSQFIVEGAWDHSYCVFQSFYLF